MLQIKLHQGIAIIVANGTFPTYRAQTETRLLAEITMLQKAHQV
jgi:hypothetical protein